jgi:hypothetical protein
LEEGTDWLSRLASQAVPNKYFFDGGCMPAENFGIVMFCLMPFLFLGVLVAVLFRVLRHRETMAFASKGIVPPNAPSKDNGSDTLRWGVLCMSIGLALTLGIWPIGLVNIQYPLGIGPWMLTGFLPFFLGLGLIIVHLVSKPPVVAADEQKTS